MDDFYYDPDIEHITEIIKNRLFFAVKYDDSKKAIKCTSNTLYFSTDDELVYMSYYFDFGPLNISCLYKFCCKLNSFLQCTTTNKKIVYYSRNNENARVNSACLIGCFAVIYLDLDPRQVYRTLLNVGGPYRTFVDASQGNSQFTIRLLDCLLSIEKARSFQFFNFDDFNSSEYDTHDKMQNGDMNWLVPRKFLAFLGPTENELMNSHPPGFYLKYFLKNGVKTVVRLNNKMYNSNVFTEAGINHYDLIFPDGTTPPKSILLRFLDISERTPHAIAVHCKAGLGRTGSLIGAFIIKHYHFTAREAIAWMRMCRPGSVIGQQQGWLEKIESWLWRQGNQYRFHNFGEGDKIPTHKYGIYSKMWAIERKKVHIIRKKEEERRAVASTGMLSMKHIMPTMKMHISSADSKRGRAYEGRLFNKEKDIQHIKKILNKGEATQQKRHAEKSESSKQNKFQNRLLSADSNRRSSANSNRKSSADSNRKVTADSNRRLGLEDRNVYEPTQGDRLNEIKMRKHLGLDADKKSEFKTLDVRNLDARKLDVGNLEVRRSEMRNSKVRNSGARNSEVRNSEVRNSEVRNLAVRNSEVRNSEVRNSEVRHSEVRNSEVRNSEVRHSEVRNSEVRNPEVRNSAVRNSEVRNSDVRNFEVRNSEVRNSDVRNSEVRNSEVRNFEVRNSAVRNSEIRNLEGRNSDIKNVINKKPINSNQINNNLIQHNPTNNNLINNNPINNNPNNNNPINNNPINNNPNNNNPNNTNRNNLINTVNSSMITKSFINKDSMSKNFVGKNSEDKNPHKKSRKVREVQQSETRLPPKHSGDRYGKESVDDIIRRRISQPYTDIQGQALNKMKAKHLNNIKDIIANQDARKRVLEILSPLKSSTVHRQMYKKISD